jgi:hypothetical protein
MRLADRRALLPGLRWSSYIPLMQPRTLGYREDACTPGARVAAAFHGYIDTTVPRMPAAG